MTTAQCPRCGANLPANAPEGLCPKCLLQAGLPRASDGGDPTAANRSQGDGFVPPSPEALGEHFPKLEILKLIGRGGMGAVYQARQRDLGRMVALKILPSEIGSDPAFAERFSREARALARLSHANIVTVFDSGQAGGLYYFVMEYIDGVNLRQAMQASQLSPEEALAIVPQICDALQYAHDEGIVHRDIKPENVLIDSKGRVKIADFGLAKLLGHEPTDLTLTQTRQVMGTPRYMAPEQMTASHNVDHRADIYSLGVVFYELLTGEVPMGRFEPPSQRVQVDVRLDEVVLRTLERQPEKRYQRASEVKTDLETLRLAAAAPLPRRQADDLARLPTGNDERARQEVKIPAIGLMVVGLLMLPSAVLPLCAGGLLLGRQDPGRQPPLDGPFREWEGEESLPRAIDEHGPPLETEFPESPEEPALPQPDASGNIPSGPSQSATLLAIAATGQEEFDAAHSASGVVTHADGTPNWFWVAAVIGSMFFVLLPLAGGILITLAGWRMLHLKSHGLAVFASILALLPCQPVFLLSAIFGIWSLVVLNRPHVKAAFESMAHATAPRPKSLP